MKKIADIRDETCTDCRLSGFTRHPVCQMGKGTKSARIMVVSKMPNSQKYQDLIEDELSKLGLDLSEVYFTAAVKCLTFDVSPSRGDIKACKQYLDAEVQLIQPEWVLCFGNEALQSLTGHSGITKYRGRVIDKGGASIIPTISPAAVHRNPGQAASWRADLAFFVSQVKGKAAKVGEPKVLYVNTQKRYAKLKAWLKKATLISYDVETSGFDEFAEDAAIVSLAGTLEIDGEVKVFAMPLDHPQSPFRKNWQAALRSIAPLLVKIPKQVAHNGKFDARWLRQFGVNIGVTFDTMLACHILDENRQKGLKPQATSRFGVADWSISTKNLYDTELSNVLWYNALDTWYTYHIYLEVKQELIEQPRLLRIFRFITTKANQELIDIERNGVWIDRERLATRTKIAFDMRDEIDAELMKYVPSPPHPPEHYCVLCKSGEHQVSPDFPTNAKGKYVDVNFNPSNFARWWLFEHLGLPVLERGKEKEDGREGDPSMKEAVMLELRGQHPVVELLLKRTKWQKYCSSFLDAYGDLLDEDDRIHTTFKLAGTVTGRLSSGKVDQDKVTARAPIRGVNLQQVPRDPFIRGLFGAPPGYVFVEADFSQIELRVVAFIAREERMLYLYQTGQDIHRATAAWVLGKPPDQIDSGDRKKAKAVNFGFVYGMGANKFVHTAFENYDLVVTLDEAKAIRRAFFDQFSGLPKWHARQRRLVQEYGRVQSPIGRIRHLPDIYSEDEAVRGEAQRQAINSPVQSFASDMTMLSLVSISEQFREHGYDAITIGTVHDAILFQIREDHVGPCLPIIKDTMEHLPFRRLFGIEVDVPIIADLKVGRYWGDAKELETEQVYDWNGDID